MCKDHPKRYVDSFAVPQKGVQHRYPVEALARVIKQTGYNQFTFKSDQEAALLALKRAAVEDVRQQQPDFRVQSEESPTYASQSNAVVERCNWEVASLVRAYKSQVQALHGVVLDANHPILVWAVRYAGQMLSRAQRSTFDGKTAYELRRGKPYRRRLPPFGEAISFMRPGKHRAKLSDRFETGIYLGLVESSDEVGGCLQGPLDEMVAQWLEVRSSVDQSDKGTSVVLDPNGGADGLRRAQNLGGSCTFGSGG